MKKDKSGSYLCIKTMRMDTGDVAIVKGTVYQRSTTGAFNTMISKDRYDFNHWFPKKDIKKYFTKLKGYHRGRHEIMFAEWCEAEGYTMTTEKMNPLDFKKLFIKWNDPLELD